jgi:ribonuclease D
MPAAIKDAIRSGVQDAGPSVQTIFVLLIILPVTIGFRETGVKVEPPSIGTVDDTRLASLPPCEAVGQPLHVLRGRGTLPPGSRPCPGVRGANVCPGTPAIMEYEYIDTPDGLADAIQRLRNAAVLGVDTEAAGYHRYLDRLSLVQVSSPEENLLIDPVALPDLSGLAPLLADSRVEKVFHDADYDLRILDRDQNMTVAGLFDTQIAAAFAGQSSLGLGAVIEAYLGLSLPKAYQRADWAERPLSEGMKDYAATDTAYLLPLRERLIERLEALGRLHWAREEFARREGTRWSEAGEPGEAFLRMKGARDLKPRGLAILRELYAWREQIARERDQATFRVLSNQALLAISLRAPKTREELAQTEGVPGSVADRRGNELLAAVRRGMEVPEEDLPRFPPSRRWERDPEVEARAERLREARARAASALQLDPGFLMSRNLLDEVARRNPRTPEELLDIPDVRAWQVEALGEDLLRTLRSDG